MRFTYICFVPESSIHFSKNLVQKEPCGEFNNWFLVFWSHYRTKWKRQTSVGLELLAEAGNYSALQRMFPSPYFYHPSLLGTMDSTTAAAAAAAMYSSMYRTPSTPHPSLQRPLVPRVLIHGLGPGGQPALNPIVNPMPGTPHPR